MNRDTERRLMIRRSPVIKDISAYVLWDTVLPIGIIARIRWILLEEAGFSMTVAADGERSCALPSSTLAGELGDGKYHPGPASAILEIPVSWYLDDFSRTGVYRQLGK